MAHERLGTLIGQLLRRLGARDGGRLTDGQLLERLVEQRDHAAFESLLWRHGPMVLGVCRRVLRNQHDAEDAFQAVFLVFFRKAGSISRRESVAAWLHKVALRVALKAQAEARKRFADNRVEDLPARDESDSHANDELRSLLDDALQSLPAKYRFPIISHYLEGKTVQQTAEEAGCPPGTISGRLNRAKQLLRRRLIRRGVALSGAVFPAALEQGSASAALSGALAAHTLEAIRLFSAKAATAGVVSPAVTALAEATLHALSAARWKMTICFVLALGLTGTGASLVVRHMLTPSAFRNPPSALRSPSTETTTPIASKTESGKRKAESEPLPPGARVRLGTTRFQHGNSIHALALSPDGKIAASAGMGRAVRLWDAATGKLLRNCVAATDGTLEINTVAFTSDGEVVAAGDAHGFVHFWNTDTGERRGGGRIHEGAVHALLFAVDDRMLISAGADGLIHFWESKKGKHIRSLKGHRGAVHALALSADGKTLASGGADRFIRLWNAETGAALRVCGKCGAAIHALAFAPNGRTVASAETDKRVILWRTTNGKPFLGYDLRPVTPLTLAFADDSRLIVGGDGSLLRLYDVADNAFLHDFHGLSYAIESVVCSRNGRTLFAAGQDGVIRRWNIASGEEEADWVKEESHCGAVLDVAISPDGKRIASAGLDGTVRLWDRITGRMQTTLRPQWQSGHVRGNLCAVAFAADGRHLAAAGSDGAIHLWNAAGGQAESRPAHRGRVLTLAYSPNGQYLFSAGKDGLIRQWRTKNGDKVRDYQTAAKSITHIAVSPNGNWLAAADAVGNVYLWQIANGEQIRIFAGVHGETSAFAFSPDAALLAICDKDGLIRLNDPSAEKDDGHELNQAKEKAVALAFAPNGRTLAVAGRDGVIRIHRLSDGGEIERFAGHRARITSLAFTSDGRTLASSSNDGTVLLWNVEENKP